MASPRSSRSSSAGAASGPTRSRRPNSSRWHSDGVRAPLRFRAARGLLRLLLGAVFRVRVQDRRALPAGPSALACNHLTWVDPFVLLGCFPPAPPPPLPAPPPPLY